MNLETCIQLLSDSCNHKGRSQWRGCFTATFLLRHWSAERLLLLSGPWLKSLVLFWALLALKVHRLLGEANRFPRFSCGSFVVSPSGKCLLHTLWKSLRSSSTRSSTSSHHPRLGCFCGIVCKDTLLSLYLVTAHDTLILTHFGIRMLGTRSSTRAHKEL